MYDVLIIGGGPAGSSAGRRAGELELKTLLIEKEIFPRYKPCAGGLSNLARSYLNFVIPAWIVEKEIFGARVQFNNRAKQVIEVQKDYRIATLVSRSIFDDYLLKQARKTGMDVIMGEKVLNCQEKEDRVEVFSENSVYRAKYVIIAEGARGNLKKLVRNKTSEDQIYASLVTEIPKKNEVIVGFLSNTVNIHFGLTHRGYGWIFPHDNYYSVGLAGLAGSNPGFKRIMKTFLEENGFTGEYKLKGNFIPAGEIKRKLQTGRIFLAGDAAGFVDSFTGEGITYAVRSGQLAAGTIYEILSGKRDGSSLEGYVKACKQEFGGNLNYSLKLARKFHNIPEFLFDRFVSKPRIIDKFLDIPAGRITYKEFNSWLPTAISKIPRFKC